MTKQLDTRHSPLITWILTKLGLQVRIDDSPGWTSIARAGLGPNDRNWPELYADLLDIMEMWRSNFMVRQVVKLTTAYVVGDGIGISSSHSWVAPWIKDFCEDKQNHIADRLPAWCDELTRSGELYIALFPNRITGMQYVRAIPASAIEQVITDPQDYENEVGYLERVPGELEPRIWNSASEATPGEPCLLHFTVNKPVGATRGESDLTPILKWAKRYDSWLTERVRFNRIRNELALMHIQVQDESKVESKREQYESTPPSGGSIIVTGPGETITFPAANIRAYDAAADGKSIRLAFAAGANIPLHFLSEGSDSNRATAAEMGDPTHRHYRMRQQALIGIIEELVATAYDRYATIARQRKPDDLRLEIDAPDVSREDNAALAAAAGSIVTALATMAAHGWADNETAIRIAYKFAGEILTEEKIKELIENADNPNNQPQQPDQNESNQDHETNQGMHDT